MKQSKGFNRDLAITQEHHKQDHAQPDHKPLSYLTPSTWLFPLRERLFDKHIFTPAIKINGRSLTLVLCRHETISHSSILTKTEWTKWNERQRQQNCRLQTVSSKTDGGREGWGAGKSVGRHCLFVCPFLCHSHSNTSAPTTALIFTQISLSQSLSVRPSVSVALISSLKVLQTVL